jgi:hypothetical protein
VDSGRTSIGIEIEILARYVGCEGSNLLTAAQRHLISRYWIICAFGMVVQLPDNVNSIVSDPRAEAEAKTCARCIPHTTQVNCSSLLLFLSRDCLLSIMFSFQPPTVVLTKVQDRKEKNE